MDDIEDVEDLDEGPNSAYKLHGESVEEEFSKTFKASPVRSSSVTHQDTPRPSDISSDAPSRSGRARKRPRGFSPSPEVESSRSRRSISSISAGGSSMDIENSGTSALSGSNDFAIPQIPAVRKRAQPARRFSPTPSPSTSRQQISSTDSDTHEWIKFTDFTCRLKDWPIDDFELPKIFYDKLPHRVRDRMTLEEYWDIKPVAQENYNFDFVPTSEAKLNPKGETTSGKRLPRPSRPTKPAYKNRKSSTTMFMKDAAPDTDSSDDEMKTQIVRRSEMGAAPFSTEPPEKVLLSDTPSGSKLGKSMGSGRGSSKSTPKDVRTSKMPTNSNFPDDAPEENACDPIVPTPRRGRPKAATVVNLPSAEKKRRSLPTGRKDSSIAINAGRRKSSVIESEKQQDETLTEAEIEPPKRGRGKGKGKPPSSASTKRPSVNVVSSSTPTSYTRRPAISAEEVKKRVQARAQSPLPEVSLPSRSRGRRSKTTKESPLEEAKNSPETVPASTSQNAPECESDAQLRKMSDLSFTTVDNILIAPHTPQHSTFEKEDDEIRDDGNGFKEKKEEDASVHNVAEEEETEETNVHSEDAPSLKIEESNSLDNVKSEEKDDADEPAKVLEELPKKTPPVAKSRKKKRKGRGARKSKMSSDNSPAVNADDDKTDSGNISKEVTNDETDIAETGTPNITPSSVIDVRRSQRASVPTVKLRGDARVRTSVTPVVTPRETDKPIRAATNPNSALGIIQRASNFSRRSRRSPTPDLNALLPQLLQKNSNQKSSSPPVVREKRKSAGKEKVTQNSAESPTVPPPQPKECEEKDTADEGEEEENNKVEMESDSDDGQMDVTSLLGGSSEKKRSEMDNQETPRESTIKNTDSTPVVEEKDIKRTSISEESTFDENDMMDPLDLMPSIMREDNIATSDALALETTPGSSAKPTLLSPMSSVDKKRRGRLSTTSKTAEVGEEVKADAEPDTELPIADERSARRSSGSGHNIEQESLAPQNETPATATKSTRSRTRRTFDQINPAATPSQTVESGRSRRNAKTPAWMQEYDTGKRSAAKKKATVTPEKKSEPVVKEEADLLLESSSVSRRVIHSTREYPLDLGDEDVVNQDYSPRIKLKISLSKQKSTLSGDSFDNVDLKRSDPDNESVQSEETVVSDIVIPGNSSDKIAISDIAGLPDYVPSEKPCLGLWIHPDGHTENLGRCITFLMDSLLMNVCNDGIKHSSWRVTKKQRLQRAAAIQRERTEAKTTERREAKLRGEHEKEKRSVPPLSIGLASTRERRGSKAKLPHDAEPYNTRGRTGRDSMEAEAISPRVNEEELQELVKFYSERGAHSKSSSPLGSPAGRRRKQSVAIAPPEPIKEPTPEPVDRQKIYCSYAELIRNCDWEGGRPLAKGISRQNQPIVEDLFYREMLTKRPDSLIEVDDVEIDIEGTDLVVDDGEKPIDPPPENPLESEKSREIADQIVERIPRPVKENGEWGLDDVMECLNNIDIFVGDHASDLRRGRIRKELFQRVLQIVTSQYVSDETCALGKNGNSVHYVIAQKNAQRFRDAMTTFSQEHEYAAYWVHRQLTALLPQLFLASYITVLRHGKKLNNSNVSILNRSLKLPKDCDAAQEDFDNWEEVSKIMVNGCRNKLGDPNSDEVSRTTLERLLPDVILITVNPYFSSADFIDQKVKYQEYIYRMLRSVCCASSQHVSLKLPEDVDEKMSIPEAVDFAVNHISAIVQQCLKEHRNKRIVLAGWSTSSYINHRVIQMIPGVSALIDFAFPCVTAIGPRGSADDDLSLTYCPTLFVVGEKALDYHPKVMKNIRESMIQHSGLVVVGAANENLCIDTDVLSIENTTHRVVTRGIVEQVVDFLQLEETHLDRTELVPIELNPAFNVDITLVKGPIRISVKPIKEDERPQSTASFISEGVPVFVSHEEKEKPNKAPKPPVRKRKADRDAPPPSHNPDDLNPIPIGHGGISGLSAKEKARQMLTSALFAKPFFNNKAPSPLASPVGPAPKRRPATPVSTPQPQSVPAGRAGPDESGAHPINPANISLG